VAETARNTDSWQVEVTTHHFNIGNLAPAFFCATCATLTGKLLQQYGILALFSTSRSSAAIDTHALTPAEAAIFLLVGVGSGLTGCAFIKLMHLVFRIRTRFFSKWPKNSLALAAFVVLPVVVISFLQIMDMFPRHFPEALGIDARPDQVENSLFERTLAGYTFSSIDAPLMVYFPLKLVLTAWGVMLPLPSGMIQPTFILGGAFGRLVAEVLQVHLPGFAYEPWELAIVGAAATVTGVTRAVSTGVMVLELSGNFRLSLPMGLAIVAAYYVGSFFTLDAFKLLVHVRQLPHVPALSRSAQTTLAYQVMKPLDTVPRLPARTTSHDVQHLLSSTRSRSAQWVAIVRANDDLTLLGCVTRAQLQEAIKPGNSAPPGQFGSMFPFFRAEQRPEANLLSLNRPFLEGEAGSTDYGSTSGGYSSNIDVQFCVSVDGKEVPLDEWARPGETPVQSPLPSPMSAASPFYSSTKVIVNIEVAVPYRVVEHSRLDQVELVFNMFKLNTAFVVSTRGKLVNIYTTLDQTANVFLIILPFRSGRFPGWSWLA
jgi:hypothetical protein